MHGNMIDISGQRFGRLIAIIRTSKRVDPRKTNSGEYYWLCKCDCGNEKEIMMSSLRRGDTTSCGCYGKEQRLKAVSLMPGQANFNALFCNYKNQAKRRRLDFLLSDEQFRQLVESNCHYCDSKPSQIVDREPANIPYLYNGIDRVDNSIGYTKENCIPCCKICNYMKRNMTYDEFLAHIKKINNLRNK